MLARRKGKQRVKQEKVLRIHKKPKLSNPSLVAAWPGIGNVALGAAGYLKEKLPAKEFAEIEPLPFFDLNEVFIDRDIVQPPQFPQSKFYYWKNRKAKSDLIIFLGEAQPVSHSYELANKILDLACQFGVKRIYTFAAALVPELTNKPRVWIAATNAVLLEELKKYGLVLKGNFYVAGMNGLLLSVAKQRDIEGVCLLGETPDYLSEMGNPPASKAVLNTLAKILQIEIDMTELNDLIKQTYRQVERMIKGSCREFIHRFTVPLWERSENEEGKS